MAVIIQETQMSAYTTVVKRFDGLVERCVQTIGAVAPVGGFEQGDVLTRDPATGVVAKVAAGTEANIFGVVDRDVVEGEKITLIVADAIVINDRIDTADADRTTCTSYLTKLGIWQEDAMENYKYGEL